MATTEVVQVVVVMVTTMISFHLVITRERVTVHFPWMSVDWSLDRVCVLAFVCVCGRPDYR